MAYRNTLKFLLKRLKSAYPVAILATSIPMFINPDPPKNLTNDQKLQFEPLNIDNFSYDYLLQQSTINAVNSATQVLTVTYTAIETISKEYRTLLSKLIALTNEAIMHEVGDSHWDEILAVRAEMQVKKQIITQFLGYMNYVHKMAESASEISFLAGMDNLSTSLTQRIDDALRKIESQKTNNYQLEEEYVKVQEESIRSSNKNEKKK